MDCLTGLPILNEYASKNGDGSQNQNGCNSGKAATVKGGLSLKLAVSREGYFKNGNPRLRPTSHF